MLKRVKGNFLRWWSKPVRPLLLLIPTIVVSVLLVAGSTLAWYISTDSAPNNFKGDKLRFNIELIDVFTRPSTPPLPGSSFKKIVGATNTGDIPGFVRLLVQPIVFARDLSGATPLPAELGVEVLLFHGDPPSLVPGYDTAHWLLGEDGYFYYLGVLMPGETAPPLFTYAGLAGTSVLGPEYISATMKIEVKVEGVDYYQWNYCNAWWENPASPPAAGDLGTVESILSALAK